ncbi:S26 family signal peptidase [Natrialba sp. PRR66]|uniref:S26 family signal peptidase n=1 Tax=Natrialba sp. PRR66 TaxID=3098146 RepID=UPI002B1D78C2|nr:S26 family signal peptidase [Natrialba sp. PRR66]
MSGPDSGGTDDDGGDRSGDGSAWDDTDDRGPTDRSDTPGPPAHTTGDNEREHDRDQPTGPPVNSAETESETETETESGHASARSGARTGPNGGTTDRDGTGNGSRVTIEDDGLIRWFLQSDDGSVVVVRDVLSSVAIVAAVGLLLFAVSGIWPPLVAVESGSMEPNMQRGDLVFVVDDNRFVGDNPIDGTGIVTRENAQESGYDKFGGSGDVIVFLPNGDSRQTPVIHRAHFWVEEDENWIETKADEDIVGDVTCNQVRTCPAPHDGFVTKGDNNNGYDQYEGGARTTIVHPDWVTGKAMYRIPWLGHIRLAFDSFFGGMLAPSTPGIAPIGFGGTGAVAGAGMSASAGLVAAAGRYRS